MRAVADAAGERVLIGETHGQDPVLAASCHGRSDDELHMAFNFDFLFRKWGAREFRDSAERWYALLPEGAWPNFTLSNHDQPRHAWRYRGRGLRRARAESVTEGRARVAAAMLLTLRGTPFLYYGEEMGMSCERHAARRPPRSHGHSHLASALHGPRSGAHADAVGRQGERGLLLGPERRLGVALAPAQLGLPN